MKITARQDKEENEHFLCICFKILPHMKFIARRKRKENEHFPRFLTLIPLFNDFSRFLERREERNLLLATQGRTEKFVRGWARPRKIKKK